MQFDLVKFFRTATKPYQTKFSVDLSAENFPGYRVEGPVEAGFSARVDGSDLVLQLEIFAEIQAECARCLSPLKEEYRFERFFVLKERELEAEENELPVDLKGVLDLRELVFQELVLEVPTVLLCSDDCLGLCPVCGKNKAAGCTCQAADEPAPTDPRLSILKQLLN